MTVTLYRDTFFGMLASAAFAIAFAGCGTVQEGTVEDDWKNTPPVSVTARLEYRIDSLTNENRRLRQQLDAMQSENTNLNARLTELQSKPAETAVTPHPVSTPGIQPVSTPAKKTVVTPGYESALTKFRAKDFKGAIDQFKSLIASGISDDLADNCHYWIGESYFAEKKYKDAIQSFETVVGMTGSDKADDAQFMIGNSYQSMGNKSLAKEAYQKLITAYPSSPLVKRAKAKMGSL